MVEEIDESVLGFQHLNEEAIACTIGWLESIEDPESDINLDEIDWRTKCGVFALQLRWLRDEKLRRI